MSHQLDRSRIARNRSVIMHMSGGQLKVPRTDVERLMLVLKLRKLKSDYLRRNA